MKRIATFLRKVADLFDPRVGPSDERSVTVAVNADLSGFEASMQTAGEIIDRLMEKQTRFDEQWQRVNAEIKGGARRVPLKNAKLNG